MKTSSPDAVLTQPEVPNAARIAVLLLALAVTGAKNDDAPVILRVGKLLDGRGGAITDATVTIQGSRIVSVERGARGEATYDLRGLMLMPGGIDTHVHISWHLYGRRAQPAGGGGRVHRLRHLQGLHGELRETLFRHPVRHAEEVELRKLPAQLRAAGRVGCARGEEHEEEATAGIPPAPEG